MSPDNKSPWQYTPGQTVAPGQTAPTPPPTAATVPEPSPPLSPAPSSDGVSWTAAEFIEHERGAGWYISLILGTVVVGVGIYFLTKDYFATAAIAVIGIILAVIADHKPKQITYEIGQTGLRVGEKNYNYNLFKSFSVMYVGQVGSINLLPVKRLMPPIVAYFSPQEEKRIVDAMGEHLPYEERKPDATDRLAHRLRF